MSLAASTQAESYIRVTQTTLPESGGPAFPTLEVTFEEMSPVVSDQVMDKYPVSSSSDITTAGIFYNEPITSILVFTSTPEETVPGHFTFSGTATAPTVSLPLPTMSELEGGGNKLHVSWALEITSILVYVVLPFL